VLARIALAAAIGLLWMGGVVHAATPAEDVAALAVHVDRALVALDQGDSTTAQAEMAAFNSGWAGIEDGVRSLSRASYRGIEDAQGDANYALGKPFDAQAARRGLQSLRAECDGFVLSFRNAVPRATTPTTPATARTLESVTQHLSAADARLGAGDVAAARAATDAFAREWTDVEGVVKARSGKVYSDTENSTARVRSMLAQREPDVAGARQVLATMQSDLAPIVQAGGRYTAFDAAAILLREGLEALLVVGALLAFLNKSGNADKGRWIWAGSGLALVASLGVALLVNVLFAQATAGANRELLEGLTGLVAAILLLYVSHWLHSKSSLGAWQRYIHARGTAALAGNSVLSLAVLAFLAVFREGAETVLFYIGIAPAIALSDLVLGLGLASAGLIVFGVLILVVGVRLPLRPFFLVTSLLIYYLAFKFIGAGIHALQVSGYVSATPNPFLPANDIVGLFPTLETTVAQLVLVLFTGVVLLVSRRQAATA
jgi:high-affinity iron transporter